MNKYILFLKSYLLWVAGLMFLGGALSPKAVLKGEWLGHVSSVGMPAEFEQSVCRRVNCDYRDALFASVGQDRGADLNGIEAICQGQGRYKVGYEISWIEMQRLLVFLIEKHFVSTCNELADEEGFLIDLNSVDQLGASASGAGGSATMLTRILQVVTALLALVAIRAVHVISRGGDRRSP